MQTIELFAGCGGLAKGLELAGLTAVGFFEFNKQACMSLRANFDPNKVYEGDVRKIDFRGFAGVDVVSGGPPCQPFSLGGLAKAYDDKRDMFPQAARVISETRPKAFVFENVKGLLRKKFAPYFSYIVLRLSYPDCRQNKWESWQEHASRLKKIDAGASRYSGVRYYVCYKLLNAVDYGVPQNRERVFIVGFRSDLNADWSWPEPTCAKDGRVSISTVLAGVGDPRSVNNKLEDHIFQDGAKEYPGHTGSDVSKPAKTIKAGAHGVPGGENMLRFADGTIRYMTVREAKLIQTFPPDFRITGAWGEALRQIGNAVPVKLAQIVGRRINDVLRSAALQKASEEEIAPLRATGTDDYEVPMTQGYLLGKRASPLKRRGRK